VRGLQTIPIGQGEDMKKALITRDARQILGDSEVTMGIVRIGEKQSVSPVRILVVDDSEPFRHCIRSTLEGREDLRIVGVSSDGLEAVQKSEELQPDLILLDIGLPSLNGIEAAKRICKLAPKSKIIFLSLESSKDVVRGALSSGANGYIAKSDAASDLLVAVDAVLQGKQFVSAGLTDQIITNPQQGKATGLI
jgi:DNA-binding NarL/FixJ family response regulator